MSGNNVPSQHLGTTSGNQHLGTNIWDNILSDDEDYIRPVHRLFGNYRHVQAVVNHLVERSYEKPFKWFYLVCTPFNKNYEKDLDFYNRKGFDYVRNKIVKKAEAMIMTREIVSKKIHINVLCCTDKPLDQIKLKTNKYHVYCQECPAPQDRRLVLEYILKESKSRYFHEHLDYYYSKK